MKLKELIARISMERDEEAPFPEDFDAFLEDFVPNTLLKSDTLQIAFGVSQQEMEELYKEGYLFYEKERLSDAANTFQFLVILNPYEYRFWMGLAASEQLLGAYDKALHRYAMASLLKSEDPYPHFHAFTCYQKLNNTLDAKKALDLAYKRVAHHAHYASLKEEIERVKESV